MRLNPLLIPLALIGCSLSQAQTPGVPSSIDFQTPAVPSPNNFGGVAVGVQGGSNLYYWVSARTPGGATGFTPTTVFLTVGSANLTVSNYVSLSWSAVTGATGYDVLRSDTPSFPIVGSGSCTCAVVLNTSSLTVNDQGGALSAYPPVGLVASPNATANLFVNNLLWDPPFIQSLMNYRGTSYTSALTAYQATAPTGSCSSSSLPIVYNYVTGSLYGCISGTWTAIGGGGSSNQCVPTATASVITVAAPCSWRIQGNSSCSLLTNATITLTGAGTSTVYGYLNDQCVLTAGQNGAGTLTPSANAVVVAGVTAFPSGTTPIFDIPYNTGTGGFGTLVDDRPGFGLPLVSPGSDGFLSSAVGATGGTELSASAAAAKILDLRRTATSTNSGNAYSVSYTPAETAYSTNAVYRWQANAANTGSITVNINSLGAITAKKIGSGSVTTNLASGDICSGQEVAMVYDGTNFQVISPLCASAGSAVSEYRFQLGGVNSAGSPGSAQWNFQGSTGVTLTFSGVTAPTSAGFTDTGADSSELWLWWAIPATYTGQSVTAYIDAYASSGPTAGQTAIITLKTACIAIDGNLATTSFSADQKVTITVITGGTGNLWWLGTQSGFTMSSCTAGQTLKISMRRQSGDAGDNAAGTVFVYALRLVL